MAWWLMLLPSFHDGDPVVAVLADRWFLALGLLSLAVGVWFWARAWQRPRRVWPLLALLLGLSLIAVTGYREVHSPTTGAPQTLHALIGIASVTLLVAGLASASAAFQPVTSMLHAERDVGRLAGAVRWITYLSLAAGLLIPFTPFLAGDAMPADCAERVAATVALVFAVPLVVTATGAAIFLRVLGAHSAESMFCPRCGYSRPPGLTCPECGLSVRMPGPHGS